MKKLIILASVLALSGCMYAPKEVRDFTDRIGLTTSFDPSACEGDCVGVETGEVE